VFAGVHVKDLRAAREIVAAVEAVEVGNDAHPGQEFSFQRAFPSVQVRTIVVVEVGAAVGVSDENVSFGDLGDCNRRQNA